MADRKHVEIAEKLNDARSELMAFFDGLAAGEWDTAVYHESTTWTITDILRHLVDAERGMASMIMQWQQGQDPRPARLRPGPLEQPHRKRKPPTKSRMNSSPTFARIAPNLPELHRHPPRRRLGPKQGRHGSLRIMSIEEVCHLIADHELDHLRAAKETLGRRPQAVKNEIPTKLGAL